MVDADADDDAENGIADATVRWIPSTIESFARFLNDGHALGKEGDAERISPGALRKAFERSRVVATGDDGAYTLDIDSRGDTGFVVASKPGHEMRASLVHFVEPESDPAPAEELAPVDPASTDAPATISETKVEEATLDFALASASAISGRVTERGSGDPAIAVVMQAGMIDPDTPALLSLVAEDAASAVTGPDGGYEIRGLLVGEYRVVHRSGFSEFQSLTTKQGRRVVIEKGVDVTGVDFELSRGGTIEGIVFDLDEKLVDGAKCSVISYAALADRMTGNIEQTTLLNARKLTTAEDGHFVFSGFDLGVKYAVVAKREGFAFAKSQVIDLTEANPVFDVELRLSKGWSIAGHVLKADGTTAPHVPVRDQPDYAEALGDFTEGYRGDIETRTDEDGAFVLVDLAPGEYDLTAGEMKSDDFFLQKMATTRVVLDGSSDLEGVEIVLNEAPKASSALAGVVLGDTGRPIEGALKLTASKDGHAEQVIESVVAPQRDLELTLARLARISRKVLLVDGSPGPVGAKVRARKPNENTLAVAMKSFMGASSKSNTEGELETGGRFSIPSKPGRVEVIATVPGHAPGLSGVIDVVAGQEYDGVEIVVSVGAIVHGRVLFPEGGPAKGSTVSVRRVLDDGKKNVLAELMPEFFAKAANSASTDSQGVFEIPHLAPGKSAVLASHKKYAPAIVAEIKVRRDEERKTKDLVLRVGSGIIGSVEVDGKPKAGMMLQLMSAHGMKRAFSRPDGSFDFDGLVPGDYMLTAMDMAAMMKQRWIIKNLAVVVEQDAKAEVDSVFGVGRKVYGEVTGITPGIIRAISLRRPGGPAPEEVDALNSQQMFELTKFQAGFTMVTKDGPYEVPDVEPGKYILEIIQWPTKFTSDGEFEKVQAVPELRREVTVRDQDLKLDLKVP